MWHAPSARSAEAPGASVRGDLVLATSWPRRRPSSCSRRWCSPRRHRTPRPTERKKKRLRKNRFTGDQIVCRVMTTVWQVSVLGVGGCGGGVNNSSNINSTRARSSATSERDTQQKNTAARTLRQYNVHGQTPKLVQAYFCLVRMYVPVALRMHRYARS